MNGIWSNSVDYLSPVSKWTLRICFLSLLTNIKSADLSCMTIVVPIQIVLMGDVVLQLMCIVMTNPNVKSPLVQYLDWFMALVQVEMPVRFSFVINHSSI